MIEPFESQPIEFMDNGRVNVEKLKQEIDRRIAKVGNLCLLASNVFEYLSNRHSKTFQRQLELPKPIL